VLAWLQRKPNAEKQVRKALGAFELPTFPAVVARALSKLRDPEATLPEIASLLELDPGVTTRLLGVANSTAFALRHPVRSVAHAVSLLGRAEVESLLLGISITRALPSDPGAGYEHGRFWTAATRRAAVGRALAQQIERSRTSEVFTSALLQEMAIPLLVKATGERYAPLLEAWRAGEAALETMERDTFGWDHATVAGWMAERWSFPAGIANAIGAHHDGAGDVIDLVSTLGEGDDERERERIIERVHALAGIPRGRAALLVEEGFTEADDLRRALGV